MSSDDDAPPSWTALRCFSDDPLANRKDLVEFVREFDVDLSLFLLKSGIDSGIGSLAYVVKTFLDKVLGEDQYFDMRFRRRIRDFRDRLKQQDKVNDGMQ